jgi:general secretion pathway protein A
MDYFKILNLGKEPFSNSPDPEFFFRSRQHTDCLQSLELSIRLQRGLNVVIGDVGTGKTTLCRQLIRQFAQDDAIDTHLILDPNFSTPSEFLLTIAEMFRGSHPEGHLNDWQVKEIVKKHLFEKGVEEEKIVILIIDEGQKIPDFCLEILREFLNYETNESKLLQIVIFGQKELDRKLDQYPNFSDRINLKHHLEPMGFADTKSMIQFRLDRSSQSTPGSSPFTTAALWAIYRKTGGYPRKIIHLCHRCILAMIIQNRTKINRSIVRSCAGRNSLNGVKKNRWVPVAVACIIFLLIGAGLFTDKIKFFIFGPSSINLSTAAVKPKQTGNRMEPAASVTEGKPNIAEPIADRGASHPEKPIAPAATESFSELIIEEKADPSEKIPVIDLTVPEMLGTVTLGRNETLWRLVEKVYGIFDNQRFNALRNANPSITNPNRVELGQIIHVPAIPAEVDAGSIQGYWIEIEKAANLETAVDFLRNYPENSPPIRILPHWNPREGLEFSLLLKEQFENEPAAARRLHELTHPAAPGRVVVSSWDSDTIFFSNPSLN